MDFKDLDISQENKDQISAEVDTLLAAEKATAKINADAILNGAMNTVAESTGIARNQDEAKASDYFIRAAKIIKENSLKGNETAISERDSKIAELTKSIENNGDDVLKTEFEKLKGLFAESNTKYDTLLSQSEADKLGYQTDLANREIDSAIKGSMPAFSDKVNEFELKYKTTDAIKSIKDDHKLFFDENGKLVAEHKEKYTKSFVSDILKDKLKDMIGEDVTGGGGRPPEKGATTLNTTGMNDAEKTDLWQSHLKSKGIVIGHPDYSKQMDELISKDIAANSK